MVHDGVAGSDVAARRWLRRCARRSCSSAASTSSSTPRPSIPTPDPSAPAEDVWAKTLQINVTSNYVLAQEGGEGSPGAEAAGVDRADQFGECGRAEERAARPYDVSKAAINHLIRELAIGLGPLVRVNGIAPATVIAGSSMFPRDRVIVALKKYRIAFAESESTEDLRGSLRSSTRSARSRAAPFCRWTTRTPSAGSPASKAPRPPAT